MRIIIIHSGQSIWDIAMQYYGGVEGVEWIVKDNQDKIDNVCDYIKPGTLLKIRDEVIDQSVVDYFVKQNKNISSDFEDISGIGYWAIGVNFIIS